MQVSFLEDTCFFNSLSQFMKISAKFGAITQIKMKHERRGRKIRNNIRFARKS